MSTAPPSPGQIDQFRDAIARKLGLWFDDGKRTYLAQLLRTRAHESGDREPSAYLARLETPNRARPELRALAEVLTVPETYFFRNTEHFSALLEVALPACLEARAEARTLRILSAGCASGEEAYSLAILLDQVPALAGWGLSIRGIDINRGCLERARMARYPAWSLRATSAEMRERYFHSDASGFGLSREIRAKATFEERNLVDADPGFWHPGAFDIVFCRNVMMYFPIETMREVTARIAHSLSPGGWLFLGHAETLREVTDAFALRHTHDTFYYQLAEGAPRERAIDPVRAALPEPASPVVPPFAPPPPRTIRHPLPVPPTAAATVDPVLDLMTRERYVDALWTLKQLPVATRSAPGLQLLEAILLAHAGETEDAEVLCTPLFPITEVGAMAHHLVAIASAQRGDWADAVGHDEAATRLDTSFALPHLHLGRLARRAGDTEGARRAFTRALALLPSETDARILFFGGGFSRDALIRLCGEELRSLGDP